MCGIAGIINLNKKPIEINQLKQMTDVIAHRGPDGEGHWISGNGNVGLGHRRLSIIDLSHEADQPMHYLERYTIVFNGEIYNYIELKELLIIEGYIFKTQSDTEVLMALYDRDKEECLQLLDGMFAFVIYDKKENIAFCAKDRFGEKPFFYSYKQGEYFYFGSEMKCLWEGGIKKETNNIMLFNYLSFGYIENPQDLSETFYTNCTRLEHSHFIKISLNTLNIEVKRYYDIDWKNIDHGISLKNAKEKLQELFYTSLKRRMRSDVTVGSSLSGGLDSSLVVCIIDELKKGTNQIQNTFSAVFPGYKKDERKFIDYVISKTNIEPHFVTPNEEGLIKDIEKVFWHQEEPFASASIYAQYCVMRSAKKHNVTVLLDGQGADEILGGYPSYYTAFFNELKQKDKNEYNSQKSSYLNLHVNNSINGIIKKTVLNRVSDISPNFVKPFKTLRNAVQNIKSPIFNQDFYHQYKKEIFETPGSNFKTLNEALYSSTMKNGIQQLLRYADRNSMANSVEVRLPFLYHELIEFLFTLPSNFKMNDGWTKWLMRETFDILPNEIRWRIDKIGFDPPQTKWMTNIELKNKISNNRQKLVNNKFLHSRIINNSPNDLQFNNWLHWQAGQLI